MTSVVQLDAAGLRNRLLVQHGETAPEEWSKMQLLLRLTELEGPEGLAPKKTEISPLRVMEVEINKAARKKATLIGLIQEQLPVNLTGNETIEILKLKAMDAAYRSDLACTQASSTTRCMPRSQSTASGRRPLQWRDPRVQSPSALRHGWSSRTRQADARWRWTTWIGHKRTSKAKGSKELPTPSAATSPQLDQLTAVVGMLAKEVQSLKVEKESSDWETMTNPQWEDLGMRAIWAKPGAWRPGKNLWSRAPGTWCISITCQTLQNRSFRSSMWTRLIADSKNEAADWKWVWCWETVVFGMDTTWPLA